MDPKAVRVTSQLALAVYAESLAERGHVTVIGDSSLGLGTLLMRLGARAVDVWDPDGARARVEAEGAPRGVVVRALLPDQPETHGVDLVVVPDLGCLPEPAGILARVRRMLGDEGAALVAAANRDVAGSGSRALDYYELFDLVAKEFDCVRMIAQLPFHGVTLAELGEEGDSPAVSVDTQLADMGRSAEAFVALASQRDVRLDAYSIVELPQPPSLPAHVARAAAEVAELRSQALEAQLAAVLADRTRLATRLASEMEEMRAAAEAGRMAAVAVEEISRRAEGAERRVALLEQELLRAEAQPEEHLRFEEALRDRARSVRLLEAELQRRDHMIRELAGALEEAAVAGHPPEEANGDERDDENARLRARLDALALELARREGEMQATAWKVAELERRLDRGGPRSEGGPDLDSRLSAALDEADALRRALVQEHEALVRAQSARATREEGGPEPGS